MVNTGTTTLTKMESQCQRYVRQGKQVLIVGGLVLSFLTMGLALTWPSQLAWDLRLSNSTLTGHDLYLQPWQLDLMGSMLWAGTLPGFLLSGWLVGRFGRKISLGAAALPGILGWLFCVVGSNVHLLVAGRLLCGMTHGMVVVALNTYMMEITDVTIRGGVAAMPAVALAIGSLLVPAMGISWYHLAIFAEIILIIYVIVVWMLPESPTYLLLKGQEAEAQLILQKLRSPDDDLEKEIQQLKDQNADNGDGGWPALMKRDVIAKILTVFGLFFIFNFCGYPVVLSNATRIFKSVGSSLDDNTSSTLVFLVQLVGSLVACVTLDRLGRRRAMVLSLSIVALTLTVLGIYVYLSPTLATSAHIHNGNASWSWVPLASLMIYMFGVNLGVTCVPWILSSEYFPTSIRSQATSVCACSASLLGFAVLQLYGLMIDSLGQPGLYWTYAIIAAAGIAFTLGLMKETSGKTIG